MGNNTILIVEDEAIIALEIESRLLSMGYQVCGIVSTGEKAVLLAEQKSPDLILMDLKLRGDLGGMEAAKIIDEKFAIPLIFLTAFMDERPAGQFNTLIKHPYLLKPIAEDELKNAIEKIFKSD
jgi:two-component SAPR family response regulator